MKVGIIGCGAIASRAHIPSYRRSGADVVAVCDINIERAKQLADRFNLSLVYSDYHELLESNVELVSICTPPQTHASIAIDAAKMGKHVLVEKPMATNLEDAERIVRECEANNTKLCVMHEYRFTPCIQEAKGRISRGRLGEILSLEMTAHATFPMRWSDSTWLYDRWGMLDDVGVHFLDILSFLTESYPKRVWTVARDITGKMGFFNYIQAIIELANSCVAYLDLSWIAGSYEWTVRAFGTAGKLDIDVRNNHLAELHGTITPLDEIGATLRKSSRTMNAVLTKRYFKGALAYYDIVIGSYLQSIARSEPPPVGPEDGKRVVQFLQAIKQAAP